MEVTISPGRWAAPDGMFSTKPTMPTALTLASRPASAFINPMTTPAPPISHFMSSIPADGLIEMPPVSKVTPLPTKAIGLVSLAALPLRPLPPPLGSPCHCITTILDSRSLPWPTPNSAPIPSFSIWDSLKTSTSTPSSVNDLAFSAKVSGYSTLAGSLTRSRVKKTPSATRSRRLNFLRAAVAPSHNIFRVLRLGFSSCFSLVLYLSNRYERRRAPKAISAAISVGSMSHPLISSIISWTVEFPRLARAA